VTNSEVKVAIIGAGRWGMNHIKTAATITKAENILVCDRDSNAGLRVKSAFPGIGFTTETEDVVKSTEFKSIIVATPAELHYPITKQLLQAGKHVLVEKPITLHLEEAEELVKLAKENGSILMVGHVLLYHAAVRKMKEEIDNGRIGKLQYIYSNRLNLGAIRSEENILWSFAPHDVSLIQYLTGENPVSINANGAAFVQSNIEDTTLTYLKYPSGVNAHIFVSWLHPFKEQRMVATGTEGMLVFEDSLPTEKLKFFKKGFRMEDGELKKFEQDYEVIEFDKKQPLYEEQMHFYHCCQTGETPLTDGQHAYDVLKVLVTATQSLKN
jgi:UDP-2-acetamido-3-amino-2,3-dideoxy-glucuronate N-acetyltransferase